ncbi:conserved membrane hypothetical protein [Rhizobium sp. EC-SD404]|nr:conserved membrane hypothetical protein [Rhizobium sp. EC-SD404]
MILLHVQRSLKDSVYARGTEWLLAIALMMWGPILWNNPELFALPQYSQFESLMSQETWAWTCFLLGAGRIGVLLWNGAYRRTPHMRVLLSLVSMIFWYQISISFWMSNMITATSPSTWLAAWPVFCMFEFINIGRAARDAKIADEAA